MTLSGQIATLPATLRSRRLRRIATPPSGTRNDTQINDFCFYRQFRVIQHFLVNDIASLAK
jgi:hypothetical protein